MKPKVSLKDFTNTGKQPSDPKALSNKIADVIGFDQIPKGSPAEDTARAIKDALAGRAWPKNFKRFLINNFFDANAIRPGLVGAFWKQAWFANHKGSGSTWAKEKGSILSQAVSNFNREGSYGYFVKGGKVVGEAPPDKLTRFKPSERERRSKVSKAAADKAERLAKAATQKAALLKKLGKTSDLAKTERLAKAASQKAALLKKISKGTTGGGGRNPYKKGGGAAPMVGVTGPVVAAVAASDQELMRAMDDFEASHTRLPVLSDKARRLKEAKRQQAAFRAKHSVAVPDAHARLAIPERRQGQYKLQGRTLEGTRDRRREAVVGEKKAQRASLADKIRGLDDVDDVEMVQALEVAEAQEAEEQRQVKEAMERTALFPLPDGPEWDL
jgi:hypothetical protein